MWSDPTNICKKSEKRKLGIADKLRLSVRMGNGISGHFVLKILLYFFFSFPQEFEFFYRFFKVAPDTGCD